MTAPRHYYYPPVLLLILLVVTATFTAADDDAATTETIIVASIEIELNANVNANAANTGDISDKNEKCEDWAKIGECQRNPGFMLENCAVSCDTVSRKGKAYVYDGEDVGVGAFRFAEEYSNYFDSTTDTQQKVLEVAKELQDELKVQNYTPPQELTHCGKRQCSAGKLWKRAEEMRKADMHDDAGADLIRALLKTGIEIDFKERCQRSLQWAFNSIQRQRERERKEAIEEEKLEVRRKEEEAAMESALERKKEYDADLVKFGNQLQESVAECDANGGSATVGADGTVETDVEVEVEELILDIKRTFVADGPQGGNWDEVIELMKKLRPSDKTVDIFLIEARCHEMKGNHKFALSAAGRLISKAASYTSWKNDEPRMIAATLGANAAMQLGLSENALSFYQTVLKFDPEQERARKQYRGLKKVVKLMDKAEEQIKKGYNKAASTFVDECLSAMRGLDVDSPLFRSKIQLKQCTILSGMGRYEEALGNCDTAVEQREGSDTVSGTSKKEAYLIRGEALMLDMDYDEAVQDFRAAFDLVPDDDKTGEKRELQIKLQQTKQQQDLWNGGQRDQRFNEHTGYPEGMPPQRDHAKILQLPIDLEERGKDIKCAWLKKQFKMLVRKFHPDKYRGNKKRGARKFKEVKEAKEILSKAWEC